MKRTVAALLLILIMVINACGAPLTTPASQSRQPADFIPEATNNPLGGPSSRPTPTPTAPKPTVTPTTPKPTVAPSPTPTTPKPTVSLTPTLTTPKPTVTSTSPLRQSAKVSRIRDGDTIDVSLSDQTYGVRYIGIDCPELSSSEFYSQEALAKNAALLDGKVIYMEKDISDTDVFGRLLRYVFVDNVFVNAELVRLGYAKERPYPPDIKYRDLFVSLQNEARNAGRGVWALPQITFIFFDGLVPRVESDEYVEIVNYGNRPQDLKGWVLKDISTKNVSFKFPSYILQPGERIRVYTNEIHPESGGFSFGYSTAIWNNKEPEIAGLYNEGGELVSTKSY